MQLGEETLGSRAGRDALWVLLIHSVGSLRGFTMESATRKLASPATQALCTLSAMVSVVPPFGLSQLAVSTDAASLTVTAAVFAVTLIAYKLLFPGPPAHERYAAKHGLTNVKLARRLPRTTRFLGDADELQPNVPRFPDWLLEKTLECEEKPWVRHVPTIPDMIFIATPELIEDVLKNQHDVFPKGRDNKISMHDLLGESLISQDGEEWHRQRKTASKFFSARMFRDVATVVINKHAGVLTDVLDKAMESGEQVNLTQLFHEFTLQAFAELGFGLKMDLIDNKAGHPLDKALAEAFPQLVRRAQTPMWFWQLQRALNVGEEAKYWKVTQSIHSQVSEMVVNSLATSRTKSSDDDAVTIVELFIDSMRDGEGDYYSPETLRDIAVMFVSGGRDTSAETINWLTYLLSEHPQVDEKLRAELWEKVPDLMEGKVSSMSYEQSQSLIYMEAVIKETLRLHPPLPINARVAARDTVLVDGTFVPKGTGIGISSYVMGRLASQWGQDVLEFKPERFIDANTGKLATVSAFKFFSFNAGPRICLGMNLALLEIKLVVAKLVSRYRFDVAPNDGSHTFTGALPLKNPLLAHVQPARAASH